MLPSPTDRIEIAALSGIAGPLQTAAPGNPFPAHLTEVETACRIWQSWSTEQLLGEAQAAIIGEWFATQGGWHALSVTLRDKNSQRFAAWCLKVARCAPLQLGPQPIRLLNRLTEQIRQFLLKDSIKIDKVRPERDTDSHNDLAGQVLRKRLRRKSGEMIFESVQAQLRAILRALAHQQVERATEFLNDLIEYHLANGGQRYLVKSLSNLMAQARRQGALHFAQQCSELALRHAPCDQVVRNGRAEVLRSQGRLPEALAAYERVIAESPDNVISLSGRAEVLKSQGRLTESLAAYEQILSRFPNNVVARNGRAAVLKAQGRLSESLTAYEEIIVEFPDSGSARNGRAEVLKAQGRKAEACAAYEQNIIEFPKDVFARNGRAEVLKALGKLDEALDAYEQTLAEFPNDLVSFKGRAGVLRAQQEQVQSPTVCNGSLGRALTRI